MEKLILEIQNISLKFGEGVIEPNVYDTAWVARVPVFGNIKEPAFPKALEWLKNHQLEDGSWGTEWYIHGNLLNTLVSIIALKQWNHEEDTEAIQKGIKACEKLSNFVRTESNISVGFELLYPSLLNVAKKFGLILPNEKFSKYYSDRNEKIKLLLKHQEKSGLNDNHSWWFSLEFLEDSIEERLQIPTFEKLVNQNGSVCASSSATAYALMVSRTEGYDIPRSYDYLRNLYDMNDGGIPPTPVADGFELSWCIGVLLMAGVPLSSSYLKIPINKLYNLLIKWSGMMKYCDGLPADVDDTAMAYFVLGSANLISSKQSIDELLKYFNGNHFITFQSERHASISANFHCLIAMKVFIKDMDSKEVFQTIIEWVNTQKQNGKYLFEDKWHFSPFYCISRGVFALQGLNDSLVEECVECLMKNQKVDGGWSAAQNSTLEETAHVTIAICHWIKTGKRKNYEKLLESMKMAQNFLNFKVEKKSIDLWIGKTLYCPTLIVKTTILSSRYAVFNILLPKDSKTVNQKK